MRVLDFNYAIDNFNSFDKIFDFVTPNNYFWDEDQNNYFYILEMPGVKKEDLKLELKDNYLVVEAKSQVKNKKKEYYKTLTIPAEANTEKIDAQLENGILTISIPKEVKVKKLIQIK